MGEIELLYDAYYSEDGEVIKLITGDLAVPTGRVTNLDIRDAVYLRHLLGQAISDYERAVRG